jgi:excisionase family DNA binding protein
MSVADAAQNLQVSPRRVRQLVADGSLPGLRVGGRWLVSPSAIEHRQRSRPPPGRPLSAPSAWRVLAVLAHAADGLEGLSPPLRSRARSRAARLRRQPSDAIPQAWRAALRRRAELNQFYGHPSILADIAHDPGLVRSGISAAHDHGADLMVVGGAEGYLRSQDLVRIVEQYALSPSSGADANVWLRVVGSGADWLFRQRVAPAAVVAADLMERDGFRDQAAGVKLAASL